MTLGIHLCDDDGDVLCFIAGEVGDKLYVDQRRRNKRPHTGHVGDQPSLDNGHNANGQNLAGLLILGELSPRRFINSSLARQHRLFTQFTNHRAN